MEWKKWRRWALALIALGCLVLGGLFALEVFGAVARPPQPLKLGTIQWLGEVGATVDRVERRPSLGSRKAKGEFYIVHARIIAPFGLRPTWHDGDVVVKTFGHTGAMLAEMQFTVDEGTQQILDRITHRPGPVHEVRGAEQHEDLVFDMPRDVEQPGLLFLPANDMMGLLNLAFGEFWQPHRFNLRYD